MTGSRLHSGDLRQDAFLAVSGATGPKTNWNHAHVHTVRVTRKSLLSPSHLQPKKTPEPLMEIRERRLIGNGQSPPAPRLSCSKDGGLVGSPGIESKGKFPGRGKRLKGTTGEPVRLETWFCLRRTAREDTDIGDSSAQLLFVIKDAPLKAESGVSHCNRQHSKSPGD